MVTPKFPPTVLPTLTVVPVIGQSSIASFLLQEAKETKRIIVKPNNVFVFMVFFLLARITTK